MKKTAVMFLALQVALTTTPVSAAFNRNAFDACIEEYVKHLDTLEFIDSDSMNGDSARAGLIRTEKKLRDIIAGLSNEREVSQAKKAAKSWQNKAGVEATAIVKAAETALGLIESRGEKLASANYSIAAEVDVPWQMLQQKEIEKAVEQCRDIISPFSAESGFPEYLPEELRGKDWATIRRKVAEACFKCSRIMLELVEKNKLPIKQRLSAMYFRKRFVMGTSIYPHKNESDKVHEFQCRSFASDCETGLKEMKYWKAAEPLWSGDIVWVKNATEGLTKVKEMLPEFPDQIDNAREFWRQAADKAVKAGNEAGMTASRIGDFNFPSWRLKFAVKYFKAATRAAVSSHWHSRETNPEYWAQACLKLKKAIEPLRGEIDEMLNALPKKPSDPRTR